MGISSVISLAGGAAILGGAGYWAYLELETQNKRISDLTKKLQNLNEKVKENDAIANRNGPDALAQTNNILASDLLQDDFDKLSASVRSDFDSQKEQQDAHNNDFSELLTSLDTRIDNSQNQLLDLKDAFEKNANEVYEMKAALVRFTVESGENQKLMERLHDSQVESDNSSQTRVKRLEETVFKFKDEIQKRIDESNDDQHQLNKQIVNFETKTSNLEKVIQTVIDETKERDYLREVTDRNLQNFVAERLNESEEKSIKLWENLTKTETEIKTIIHQVVEKMNLDETLKTNEEDDLTEHDYDNRANVI